MSTDELRKWSHDWSETNRSLDEIADRIDQTHEAEIATLKDQLSHSVPLPIDSEGQPYPVDQETFNCIIEGCIVRDCYLTWSSDEGFHLCHGDTCTSYQPESGTIPTAPYDKHGKTIEVGDWIERSSGGNVQKPFEVTNTELVDESGAIDLCPENDQVTYAVWRKNTSHCYEVVPTPDTPESILSATHTELVELANDQDMVPLDEAVNTAHALVKKALKLNEGTK